MNRLQQYRRDSSIEQMTSNFLDEFFYSHLSSATVLPVRWHDKVHQFAGVDVSLSCSTGKLYNFDEKCKTYGTLNQQMGVLSFECSFLNRGMQFQDGWFLQDNQTQYYAFIQLSATVDDTKLLEEESQLLAADVMWIAKSDVKLLVEDNTGLEHLKADCADLRDDDSLDTVMFGSKPRKRYAHGKFWLTYSKQLREKPVNLVVPVDELLKLPHTRRFLVTKEQLVKYKKDYKYDRQ